MRPTIYVVKLSETEKKQLENMLKKGKHGARELKRARVLLLADEGKQNLDIAKQVGLTEQVIIDIKKRYCQEGLNVKDKPRTGQPKKLDDRQESYLIALACSPAPEGRDIWTMQLLADKLVELQIVDSISDEAVRVRLKKMNLSLGSRNNGVSRP